MYTSVNPCAYYTFQPAFCLLLSCFCWVTSRNTILYLHVTIVGSPQSTSGFRRRPICYKNAMELGCRLFFLHLKFHCMCPKEVRIYFLPLGSIFCRSKKYGSRTGASYGSSCTVIKYGWCTPGKKIENFNQIVSFAIQDEHGKCHTVLLE